MGTGKKKSTVIYKAGDLVFAKVKGYSFWPARIEETPNSKLPKGKYKVFFFGTHETYCLKSDLIIPFEENKETHGKPKKIRGFNDGMWEIENDPNMVLKDDEAESANSDNESADTDQDEVKASEDEDDEKDNGESEVDEASEEATSSSSSDSSYGKKRKSNKQTSRATKRSHQRSDNSNPKEEVCDAKKAKLAKEPVSKTPSPESKVKEKKSVKKEVVESKSRDTRRRSDAVKTNEKKSHKNEKRRQSFESKIDNKKADDKQEAAAKVKDNRRKSEATKSLSKEETGKNKSETKSENKPKEKSKTKKTRLVVVDDDDDDDDDDYVENKDKEISSKHDVDEEVKQNLQNEKSKTAEKKAVDGTEPENSSEKVVVDVEIKKDESIKEEDEIGSSPSASVSSASPTSTQLSSTDNDTKNIKKSREERKQILKLKKAEEKKLEYVKNIRTQLALLRMVIEIKNSLRVENTQVDRCCLIMEDLLKLPFSQTHLYKVPEIVDTIRKCRKFLNSEKVRTHANNCYNKIVSLFSVAANEKFLDVFERSREKYLAENADEISREKIFAAKFKSRLQATKPIGRLDDVQKSSIKAMISIAVESPLSSSVSPMTQSPSSNSVS